MALVRCDLYSDALGVGTSVTLILPEAKVTQIGGSADGDTTEKDHGAAVAGLPTLYLLHGLSDDNTAWTRNTSIERYVDELGLAVVMPAVSRSFYTDEVCGLNYWSYLADELPVKLASMFRLSDRRADRFVAGLSMGGYGALKWSLRRPDRFAAAASLSGALDIERIQSGDRRSDDPRMMERLFGDTTAAGTGADLFALLNDLSEGHATPPALYLTCGTDDVLIKDNRKFETACRRAGIPVTTNFGPGRHDWAYWDDRIRDVLEWLPLRGIRSAPANPANPAVPQVSRP